METTPPTIPASIPSTSTTATTTTMPSPEFQASVHPVTAEELAHSWHAGCPVDPAELVRIDLVHHDFDGGVLPGRLIVNRRHTEAIVGVFVTLFDQGYPIVSVTPIGELPEGAEDEPGYSNTSGFHCRFVEGTTRWSEHAVGNAVDVNPHLNPIIRGSDDIWPVGSEPYVDRTRGEPGMITEGDPVVTAFDGIGWGWGGRWQTLKDYHHFSSSGR